MNWYKKAQYTLFETIIMQGENGLPLKTMSYQELEEAEKERKNGFLNKVIKQDKQGKYTVYMINKEKFDLMGWKHSLWMKT